MRYCPNCKSEYYDKITVCADCGAKLVKKEELLPEREQLDSIHPVKVWNAQNKLQAEMLVGLLHNNGIPAFSKSIGSGDYLNIAQGFSVFGEDVYVDEDYEEQARELVKLFDEDHASDAAGKNELNEEKVSIPFYKNKTVIARIIVAYFVITGIILLILTL